VIGLTAEILRCAQDDNFDVLGHIEGGVAASAVLRVAGSVGELWEPYLRLFGAPGPEVVGVKAHAEEVGRNEAKLGSAHPDEADDDAVEACNDPTLPQLFPHQNGRDHGQDARDVIQARHKATLSGRGEDDCANRIGVVVCADKLHAGTGAANREPVSAGDYEGSKEREVDRRQLKVESKMT
jgi:hypothetical protein